MEETEQPFLPFCIIVLTVLAHLGEDGGDERLETGFCFLADGGLWDAGVFLDETVQRFDWSDCGNL